MERARWQVSVVLAIALVSVSATAWAGIDYGPWLTGVTQNAITVKWGSADAAGMVEYGATDALGQEADTVYANGVQEADLTSLATGTRYYYRVTSGGDTSDIHSFLTAPDENAAFHFAVISDTQGDISVYHSIAEALLPTEPEFVLHNGDLVSYPFLDSQWTNFWSVTDLVAGDAPYFPVRGNHDGLPGGKQHFELYWSDPMNEGTVSRSSYSFQYGNTYFVALDINEPYFAGSAQHQWLEDQLAYAKSLPSVKHCIVHAHFPPYSCSHHGNDPDVLAFRASVTPLFEKYDIDLYMSGHDHTYQRSVVNGLTYLVTGCSASDQYDCNPQAWTVVCEKTANYSYIVIDGDEISVEAHRPDNSLIDSFTIDHNYHGDVDDDTVDDDVTDDDATDDDAIDDDATDDDVDDDATDDDGGDDDAGGCGC